MAIQKRLESSEILDNHRFTPLAYFNVLCLRQNLNSVLRLHPLVCNFSYRSKTLNMVHLGYKRHRNRRAWYTHVTPLQAFSTPKPRSSAPRLEVINPTDIAHACLKRSLIKGALRNKVTQTAFGGVRRFS